MRGISINPRIKRDERRFMPSPADRPGEGALANIAAAPIILAYTNYYGPPAPLTPPSTYIFTLTPGPGANNSPTAYYNRPYYAHVDVRGICGIHLEWRYLFCYVWVYVYRLCNENNIVDSGPKIKSACILRIDLFFSRITNGKS